MVSKNWKMGLQYFLILCKRSMQSIRKTAGILILAFGGTVAIATVLSHVLLQAQVMPRIQVAVSIPEEETLSKMAAQYISNMDSVKSICNFTYTDDTKALAGLTQGEFQAVIVLPENFYQDVDIGLNPPVTIYVKDHEDGRIELFLDLVRSGVSYLQVAEAGVYTALDASRVYGFSLDQMEIGNTLAMFYEHQIMQRGQVYEDRMLSPFGQVDLREYYVAAGLLLCLILFGMQFRRLYDRESRVLEEQLRIHGLYGVMANGWKIGVQMVYLLAVSLLFYAGICFFAAWQGTYFVDFSWKAVGILVWISLAIAVMMNVIFVLTRKVRSGWIVMVVVLVMALCSGLYLPEAYLPEGIAMVGRVLPMQGWFQLVCKALYALDGQQGILLTGLWMMLGIGVGAVCTWKN